MKLSCFVIMLLLSIAHAFADNSSNANKASPPEFYVDKRSSCPSECCSYGEWSIKTDILGYEKPDLNSNIIGHFKKGNIAHVGSGEIHSMPGKYVVKKLNTPDKLYCRSITQPGTKLNCKIEVGDILYPYTNMGEGYYKLWYEGEFYEENLYAVYKQGEMIVRPTNIWWVYATSPLEWSGWTKETNNFGNKGSCSGAYIPHVRVIYRSENEKIRTSNEIKNYDKLLNSLSSIEGINLIGNDYAFAYGDPRSMYIDMAVKDMNVMGVKKRTAAVQTLVDTVYMTTIELGINKYIKIEASCDFCEKINIK